MRGERREGGMRGGRERRRDKGTLWGGRDRYMYGEDKGGRDEGRERTDASQALR